MAKRRERYVVTGNLSANGKSLKGVVMVDLGICGASGLTTTRDGKKLLKGDLTHRKFKIADPKVGRDLGLPKSLWEYTFLPAHVSIFLTKQEES
jgi:hypothetical protein